MLAARCVELTDDPVELRGAASTLTTQIQALRKNAAEGDIFTPRIAMVDRDLLLLDRNTGLVVDILRDALPPSAG